MVADSDQSMRVCADNFAATPEAGPCAIELNLLVHRTKRI
jgi:hypothetical protein